MAGCGGKLATGAARQFRPPVRDAAAGNGRWNLAPAGRAGRLECSGDARGYVAFSLPFARAFRPGAGYS